MYYLSSEMLIFINLIHSSCISVINISKCASGIFLISVISFILSSLKSWSFRYLMKKWLGKQILKMINCWVIEDANLSINENFVHRSLYCISREWVWWIDYKDHWFFLFFWSSFLATLSIRWKIENRKRYIPNFMNNSIASAWTIRLK